MEDYGDSGGHGFEDLEARLLSSGEQGDDGGDGLLVIRRDFGNGAGDFDSGAAGEIADGGGGIGSDQRQFPVREALVERGPDGGL